MPRALLLLAIVVCAFGFTALAATPSASASPNDAAAPLPLDATTTATIANVRAHAQRWSRDPRWLALEARNLGEAPYRLPGSAPAPSLADQLLTFATAELAPPPGTADDDRAACRQPTRWRVLQALAQHDRVALPAAATCTAMHAFSDPDVVVALEVLFVAPTTARASASFGHLLLRLVRGPEPNLHDTVYEISAITGFRDSSLSYAARGLSGAYPLVFDPQALNAALTDNLHGQQRQIQRFALNVTAPQRRAILQLLWQIERELALPYRFLNRNCATYLLWMLSTALDDAPRIAPKVRMWAAPAEILDRMAQIRMPHDGKPLLRHEPGGFESSNGHKLRALAVAEAANLELQALPAPWGVRLRASQALSPDALAALAQATVAQEPSSSASIERMLQARVIAARADHDAGQANEERIQRERIQLQPDRPLPGLPELLEWRRLAYLHEDPAWRRDQQIKRLLWIDDYAAQAPRRKATRSEREELAQAKAARQAFVRATDSYLAVSDVLNWQAPPELEDDWRAQQKRRETLQWQGEVVRSPAGMLGLRAMHSTGATGGWGRSGDDGVLARRARPAAATRRRFAAQLRAGRYRHVPGHRRRRRALAWQPRAAVRIRVDVDRAARRDGLDAPSARVRSARLGRADRLRSRA